MGGKSYFCDFCNCFMKNDINVRKAHNNGLAHGNAKMAYMRQFADAKEVLAQELEKGPCKHYFKGYCKFDFFCQFSHYTKDQLNELRNIAIKQEKRETHRVKLKKSKHAWKEQLPWRQRQRNVFKKCRKQLPASLREMEFNKLNDCIKEEWG